MAGIIDIMPTLAAVASTAYPKTHRGKTVIPTPGLNLLPAIMDNKELTRDYYYFEHIGRRGIIDSEQWKLVKYGQRPWELYNLINDRAETSDLTSERPELTEKLAQAWEKWAAENYVLTAEEFAKLRATRKE